MRTFDTRVCKVTVAAVWLLAGCAQDPQAPRSDGPGAAPSARPAPGRLSFNNDPQYLESRLVRQNRVLNVVPRKGSAALPQGAPEATGKNPPSTMSTQLTLVAEVLPPTVDGRVVQANDIDFDTTSRIAVIGYNLAGEDRAGAMQVVNFTNADHPTLVAEFLFHDADVGAVLKRGSFIYVGMASNDATLAGPALVREFRQFTGGWGSTGQWLGVPSWAVTDLAANGNDVLVTVGDVNGGLVRIDRPTMHQVGFASEPDARAVCYDAGGEAWCASGAPALSHRSLPSLGELGRSVVEGYSNDGAKGTLEAAGPYLYLGAGNGGFQVLDRAGVLLDALDNSSFGTASEPGVTNAVSVTGSLAFVAAGALGVQVVDLGRWDAGAPGVADHGLTLLGEVQFEDGFSSNMVKARSNVLVVAAGRGGVELVRMTP